MMSHTSFCPKCGMQLPEGENVRFCPNCGALLAPQAGQVKVIIAEFH
ncbi:zinc-ribbon domain-containing protein, partial [Candidatus Woesearchaeota archaeon]|nr:zinc-ribbon domain-containing protein [Candidatus Woesearchaeota archaeon]